MKIHILGICGTFMGGVALLARQLGYKVSGSDANVYPPMSTLLEQQGITLIDGFSEKNLNPAPDLVVIGNALSRGNTEVEYVLNQGIRYTSGPAFLAQHVLFDRWVIGVAGTHGKTSTASIVTWILEYAGLKPGFLIGGVPENFGISARAGESPFFVVEADEYDCAFFDKRSKFVHYMSKTVILNNLEFDHADIFPDLDAIKTQFHHLVRTIPSTGLIVKPNDDIHINAVLEKGCWTPTTTFGGNHSQWQANATRPDGSQFIVLKNEKELGKVDWSLIGEHNVNNALAAIAAAQHAGVPVSIACEALKEFKNVKRRMEIRAVINEITVYDDFAHHPTAIATTLDGLRKRVGTARIIGILEPRSNTMKLGVHKEELAPSLALADEVVLFQPKDLNWNLQPIAIAIGTKAHVFENTQNIINYVSGIAQPGDHIVIMSNGAFDGIHQRLIDALH